MKKIIFLGVGLLLLSSCSGGAKVDLLNYQETPEDKAIASQALPQYVLDSRKARVAVLPGSNSTSFKRCALANGLTEELTSVLAQTKTYNVIERSRLKGIMNEVKFASSLGGGVNGRRLQSLAKQVDYVVVASASSAQVKAQFTEARSWTDSDGKYQSSPPSCAMKAKVMTNLRVISFPSGEIKNVIQQEGVESSSTEVRSTSGCHVQDSCGMLTSAMGNALDEIKEELAATAPTYGYVYRIRSDKKDRLASISLGKSSGLEPGSVLDIFIFEEELDAVKNTKISTEVVLATCKVTETGLSNARALCEVKGDHVDLVKVKDAVRLRHDKTMLRKMKGKWDDLKNATF